jgi:hypothetical protein
MSQWKQWDEESNLTQQGEAVLDTSLYIEQANGALC